MKYLILLATLALVKGQTDPDPGHNVTCNSNHTVDIVISNVQDITEWTPPDWDLEGNADCRPAFDNDTKTVTYTSLVLPNCSRKALEVDNNETITYVLVINVKKTAGILPGQQLRSYDHLYYATCIYDNNGTATASFTPLVNKGVNKTGFGFFTFSLKVFKDDGHTMYPDNPVALDQTLYFLAEVDTQSSAPNLELFLVSCWASSGSEENSDANKVVLITNGCGDEDTSEDYQDTLVYSCAENNTQESFEIKSFRFFGAKQGASVFFHCYLRVCLDDITSSACECPAACPASRKRRSVGEYVEEIHVTSGPYYFADDKKDEGDLKEQEKPESFSTNLAIIVAVSGVVVVAVIVCVTVYLVVRSRNKRTQSNDLNVAT